MSHPDDVISLRAFVEAADEEAASRSRRELEERVGRFGAVIRSDGCRRYWKIESYFELFVIVRPFATVSTTVGRMLADLGTGWEVHRFDDGGDWAVWNAGPNTTFSIADVRWAHLECGIGLDEPPPPG